ncbi:hypothetical protein M0805_001744 [Coniferiporia weirii]|nr:hypothetical protein M0805_001744 [Coniferiporia weirii]
MYKPSAIPISATTRAVAQQPTYITLPSSPTPIAVCPPYQPADLNAPEGRGVCMECVMCDQEMVDMDVTSSGMWDRKSDVHYLDLCCHEIEEAEEHLWLSMNPCKPQARQQTIDLYIKTRLCSLRLRLSPVQGGLARVLSAGEQAQRYLLQPTPLNLWRDSQWHYSCGWRSTQLPSQGHEVTLLENSMIVEHVDMRKEGRKGALTQREAQMGS